ncbi:hypothetical protein SAMN04490244_101116 [Tranquillimonas rosea]|uniref:Uncharacterized protein n=1 Tax=Tranquillimonas rosea TaxID=641238 RepID=A0A1H9PDA1_9RHOB|nr:hypothetical protein [Tranquillimonas rosea]SER45779.1 hypothetical protein SAMN04490244_101116 [Tranquillimonas rosea]
MPFPSHADPRLRRTLTGVRILIASCFLAATGLIGDASLSLSNLADMPVATAELVVGTAVYAAAIATMLGCMLRLAAVALALLVVVSALGLPAEGMAGLWNDAALSVAVALISIAPQPWAKPTATFRSSRGTDRRPPAGRHRTLSSLAEAGDSAEDRNIFHDVTTA